MFVVVTVAALVGFGAGVASADNPLVSSSPAADSTVEASPTSIALTFTSSVGPQNTVVAACNGQTIPVGAPTIGPDGVTLNVPVVQPFPSGSCSVSWTVSEPDGQPGGSGTIAFTVAGAVDTTPTTTPDATPTTTADGGSTAPGTTVPGVVTPTPPSSSAPSSASVEGPLGLGRLALYIGLAALFGALVLIVLAWPEGVEYVLTVRFLRVAWVVALVGAYLTAAGLAARAGDTGFASGLSPASWGELTDSIPGLAALARVALTAACIWVVLHPERVIDPVTRAAAIGLPAVTVATLGLSRDDGPMVFLGYAAGIGHALAMAVWFGGLALLARVVLSGPGEIDLVHAVMGFSKLANVAIAATVVTGGVQLWRLDGGSLLSTGHGRVVLLKAVVVAGMVFVGVAARQWATTHLARIDHMPAPSAARLRRAVGIEAAVGIGVLVLTAWAMSFTPGNVEATSSAPNVGDAVLLTNSQFDITVALTQQVGPNALVVTVTRAEAPLDGFTLEFLPPPGSAGVGIAQPIPLLTLGTAALAEDDGIPLNVAGVWTVAATIGGVPIDSKNFTVEDPPAP
jgi:putative copper export protein/methionine-rich copper-binding protein CopC